MEQFQLKDFVKGWIIGNFNPTLVQTNDVEVAVKEYKKNDYEERHFHKVATEITVIVKGLVKMNDKIYKNGDIVVIKPYEATDFQVLKDTVTTVIKISGANNDKYLGEAKC